MNPFTSPPISIPKIRPVLGNSPEILAQLTPHEILSRIRAAAGLPAELPDTALLEILNQLISTPAPVNFDPKGILKSSRLHPRLAGLAETLVRAAWQAGLRVMVFEGYRDDKRQNELFTKGTTRARAGQSYHGFGLAVDLVFLDDRGNPSWALHHDWQKLGRIGKELGFVWGGDFKKIKDFGHFELHVK